MKKYLRFSMRTVLVSATIIAIGLFWIRWPSVTASSFIATPSTDPERIIVKFGNLNDQVERLNDQVERLNDQVERLNDQVECIRRLASDKRNSKAKLVALDRTFMDVLYGVQHFDYGLYEITARRGKIAVYGPYHNFGSWRLRR